MFGFSSLLMWGIAVINNKYGIFHNFDHIVNALNTNKYEMLQMKDNEALAD